jgi:hypothetical protein
MSNKDNESESMASLMKEIREVTKKQKAASKADEIRVCRAMMNDPEFKVSIYDRTKGLIGERSPREEAVKFITNTASAITGLDVKSTEELANAYKFSNKDAMFILDMTRDFTTTYLSTGRKFPIVQSANSEAAIFNRPVASREKAVPSGAAGHKSATVPAYNKVVCRSKCPKYNTNEK